ncbi:hypothetical protein O2N63_08205 [Aliiroseovarius sp. KMU-50]|uniref:Uncharacterized protein n=1 Tax=Aliiroseovarius salicola TaxID=3009082 RepID=A0ABT4W0P3_9RHOB|nr:hypothetical protein [Aliiroseovarius sp. KMU-50]MDA5094070.1 hypothetical protein [Aliiroseovarius sp. KMU-50]
MAHQPKTQLTLSEYDLMLLRSGFILPGDHRYLTLGERIPLSRLKPVFGQVMHKIAMWLHAIADRIDVKSSRSETAAL